MSAAIPGPWASFWLAVLSGLLLVFSFPKFGHPAAAWVALAPLLLALTGPVASTAQRTIGPRPFWLGLTTGMVCFAGTIYWIPQTLREFGGLPWPVAIGMGGLFCAYLALYPALFAAITAGLIRRYGNEALWLSPAVWVVTEYARGHLFTGFPWVSLGSSQWSVLPVAQLASLGGVPLLSALLAAVSAAIAYTVIAGRWHVRAMVAVLVVVSAGAIWGQWRMGQNALTRTGAPIAVGIVQGNVPQGQKWDPAYSAEISRRYLDLTERVAAQGVNLVVWPESSTPFVFEDEVVPSDAVRSVVRRHGIHLLLGSEEIQRGADLRFYNSAFLLAPDGTTADTYRKVHLVPFGEYVPLADVLFFASPLVEGVAAFSAGESLAPLRLDGHRISTAICYEIVFPALVRESVLGGSELLTTITNDAWYGRSSAPHQHFAQATLRAVEMGRYLVRSANTGISAIVDPYGRVLERSSLFETATLVGRARLIGRTTIYARIGDSLVWASGALTLVAWLTAVRGRRRRE